MYLEGSDRPRWAADYLAGRIAHLHDHWTPSDLSFEDIVTKGSGLDSFRDSLHRAHLIDGGFIEVDTGHVSRVTAHTDYFLPASVGRKIHLYKESGLVLEQGTIVDLDAEKGSVAVVSPDIDILHIVGSGDGAVVWHHWSTIVDIGKEVEAVETVTYGKEANVYGASIDPRRIDRLRQARSAIANGVRDLALGKPVQREDYREVVGFVKGFKVALMSREENLRLL